MLELDQHIHVEVSTRGTQLHQADPATPVTLKLSCRTAQTWEQHQAQLLERRVAAVPPLDPLMVRRRQRPWKREAIALVVTVVRVDPGRQHHQACEPHRGLISDRLHLGPLTPRLALQRRATGHASTSPHHYELSAADGTTFA